MNFIHIIGLVLSVAVLVSASPSTQCQGEDFEGLQERIQVIPCGKTKCKLPKEQNITVVFRFKTEHEVKTLKNEVYGIVAGIPLPFLGVHDTSACANIIHAEDKTPASCPLEANKEYIYTNNFYMEAVYPEVPLKVWWSLNDDKKKVICFEIPAVIVKKKTSS